MSQVTAKRRRKQARMKGGRKPPKFDFRYWIATRKR
jgi:hypothetical protein